MQHCGLDTRVGQHIHQQDGREVGHTNVADLSAQDQFLHGGPGLVHWHGVLLHVAPLGRVALLHGHVLERDGEVNQVQVQVLEAQVGQGACERLRDVLLVVVGVPELGIKKKDIMGVGLEKIKQLDMTVVQQLFFFTLEVMKSSSRVTSPLSMARLIPWPTWTSLP